jgi:hypothetical protein
MSTIYLVQEPDDDWCNTTAAFAFARDRPAEKYFSLDRSKRVFCDGTNPKGATVTHMRRSTE